VRAAVRSGQFRRDVKRAARRGKDMHKLRELIRLLLAGEVLPERYRNHSLRGNWKGYRDAHLEPDWLTSCTSRAPAPMPICSTSERAVGRRSLTPRSKAPLSARWGGAKWLCDRTVRRRQALDAVRVAARLAAPMVGQPAELVKCSGGSVKGPDEPADHHP
jgi:mRNA interferase YafQ